MFRLSPFAFTFANSCSSLAFSATNSSLVHSIYGFMKCPPLYFPYPFFSGFLTQLMVVYHIMSFCQGKLACFVHFSAFYPIFCSFAFHFLQFQPNVFCMAHIRPQNKDLLNVVRLPSSRCTARQNEACRPNRKADFLRFYVPFVLF